MAFLVIAAGSILGGCAQVRQRTAPPAIVQFSGDPLSITRGESSTLSWEVQEADTITINPGNHRVGANSTLEVRPQETTEYTLTARNSKGSASAAVVIRVRAETDPPIIGRFEADPDEITRGASSTLHWDVAGATDISITPGIGDVGARGSHAVTPNNTTTYTLTASNAHGPVDLEATVTVVAAGNGDGGNGGDGGDGDNGGNGGDGDNGGNGGDGGNGDNGGNGDDGNGGDDGHSGDNGDDDNGDTSQAIIAAFLADPDHGSAPHDTTFHWVVIDPDEVFVSATIVFGDGSSDHTSAQLEGSTDHTYASSGIYHSVLTVTDTDGGSTTRSATVTVTDSSNPTPPLIVDLTVDPEQGTAPLRVDASWQIVGNDLSCEINFGDGSSPVKIANCFNSSYAWRTYQHPGVYTITLAVEDGNGGTASRSREVTVLPEGSSGLDPRITTFSADPLQGMAPLDVDFEWTVNSTDSYSTRLFFGDGSNPQTSGSSANHEYASAGTYNAVLLVYNAAGDYDLRRERIQAWSEEDTLAVVAAGPRLASLDTSQSAALNLLLGTLLGTDIDLSVADYNGIANLDLSLLDFLLDVATEAGVASPEEALDANVKVSTILDLLVSAANAQSDAVSVAALEKVLLAIPNLGSIIPEIRLGDLLHLDLTDVMLGAADLNALELLLGSLQLFNYKNVVNGGVELNLGDLLGNSDASTVRVRTRVIEPPAIRYVSKKNAGTPAAEFRSASLRLALELNLVGIDVTSNDSGLLGGITNVLKGLLGLVSVNAELNLKLTDLGLYVDVAAVEGLVESINLLAPSVLVEVKPGLANVYLGEIDDALFFGDSPINAGSDIDNPGDVPAGIIGQVSLTADAWLLVNVLDITVSGDVLARAVAEGTATTPIDVTVNGPFPASETVSSGISSAADLADTLLGNLELELDVNITGTVVGLPLLGLLGDLVAPLTGAVSTVVSDLLKGASAVLPLEEVLGGILDPLLGALGVGVGEGEITVYDLIP